MILPRASTHLNPALVQGARAPSAKSGRLNMTPPPAAFCCSAHALRAGYRSISAARAGAQQQTSRTPLQLSIDGTDRQTDRRTDAGP